MSALRTSTVSTRILSPNWSRRYTTDLPRPPPPTQQPLVETFSGSSRRRARSFGTEELHKPSHPSFPPKSKPVVEAEMFTETSRPRPYYAKHPPFRDLPREKSKWPIALAILASGAAAWGAFMTYATNQEKLSSSVFRSIVRALKVDPQLQQVLGEAIRPQPEWYLNGDPLVKGRISQLQGNIDVSFRVKGSKGSGTLYFTSIRKEKGTPFTVLRFRVICDDGTIVNISDTSPVQGAAET